jgi:hypothetical protein
MYQITLVRSLLQYLDSGMTHSAIGTSPPSRLDYMTADWSVRHNLTAGGDSKGDDEGDEPLLREAFAMKLQQNLREKWRESLMTRQPKPGLMFASTCVRPARRTDQARWHRWRIGSTRRPRLN